MSLTGTWNIDIATPIGTRSSVLDLTEIDGVVTGFVRNDADRMPLINPVLQGTGLTWQLKLTGPMRLNLAFDVTVRSDTFSGTAKVGLLPPSKVTGTRATRQSMEARS